MRVAFFINTPAQYHFYKNIIKKLEKEGDSVVILARDYGETLALLKENGVKYYQYSKPPVSKIGKIFTAPIDIIRAFFYLSKFNPQMISGFGGYEVYSSFLLRVPSIVFVDSEFSINRKTFLIQFKLFYPFTQAIITPQSYRQNLGNKQIRINSYKELAYLHPKYFHPDESVKNLLNLNGGEDYVLLRFNAFDAVHDFKVEGFNEQDKIRLVHELERFAKVFISSETGVPDEIKDRVMKIPKSRIHDVIYYAKMLITDTQTMTTEAAILGTPAIRCNNFVGPNDMGNFVELEQKYGLISNYADSTAAINKALDLIQKEDLKKEWKKKKERLLNEKIDIAAFMVWFIRNFPKSHTKMKEHPVAQQSYALVPGDLHEDSEGPHSLAGDHGREEPV